MDSVTAIRPDERINDRSDLLRVIQQSLSIRRHIEVFLWLNGELQRFLPHEILIVAWGDFKRGELLFDVISAIPGVRTHSLQGGELVQFARRLYDAWIHRGSAPFTLESDSGFVFDAVCADAPPIRALRTMRSAVVHGLNDVRGNQSYLYIALSSQGFDAPEQTRAAMELLLPHLDMALRRLSHVLPKEASMDVVVAPVEPVFRGVAEPIQDLGLSARELEVMSWVRMGKTNHEIGQILNISAFTVKNHLQRVFKKLDVLNRAQAVAHLSTNGRRTHVA